MLSGHVDRVSRAHKASVPQSAEAEMDGGSAKKVAKKLKLTEIEDSNEVTQVKKKKMSIFVKVNIEGCPVGRQIDVMGHDNYESLSHALKRLFRNFFNPNYTNNSEEDETNEEDNDSEMANLIFLYQDYAGDKLVVGDVPYEQFALVVKRLFIAKGKSSATSDW